MEGYCQENVGLVDRWLKSVLGKKVSEFLCAKRKMIPVFLIPSEMRRLCQKVIWLRREKWLSTGISEMWSEARFNIAQITALA